MSAKHDMNNKNAAIPGTVGIFNYTTEIDHSKLVHHDQAKKNAAIPGTVGVFDQTIEVEHSSRTCLDQNDKNAAIPGTIGGSAQTTEIKDAAAGVRTSNDLGILRLRGESLPRPLRQEQCKYYKTNGYLVIPNAISSEEANELLDTTQNVLQRVYEGGEGIIRHDISGDGANVPSPVGRIIATFEPDDKSTSSPFTRRISRLGCGVHKMQPFDTLTHSDFHRSIVRSLGYADPRITQSQLIAKLAGIGGEIVPHQDGCVSFTDPPSAITFWYALEDTTLGNGCLEVAVGSHVKEPLRQRLVKDGNGQPRFEDLERAVWAREAGHVEQEEWERTKEKGRVYEYKPLEVQKGTLVVFHGNLLHKSGINKSEKNRMAYNFNIVEGEGFIDEDGYLKPKGEEWEKL